MAHPINRVSSRFSASDQLVVKAQFKDDIRKLVIPNENLTVHSTSFSRRFFHEHRTGSSSGLHLLIRRIFDGKLSNSNELILKYLDNDGDQVTLANDGDLAVALHFQAKLRLFVYVDGQESAAKVNSDGTLIDAKTFAEELKRIRNSVQTVLDRCEIPRESVTEQKKMPEKETPVVPPTPPREFDPYAQVLQRQRSHTPSSVRSRLFTGSRKYPTEQTPPTTPTGPLIDSDDFS